VSETSPENDAQKQNPFRRQGKTGSGKHSFRRFSRICPDRQLSTKPLTRAPASWVQIGANQDITARSP